MIGEVSGHRLGGRAAARRHRQGGTGRTTVAAALALALAAEGGKVLLMEVEEQQGMASSSTAPAAARGAQGGRGAGHARAQASGDVYALAADPGSALVEYLETFYNLPHAACPRPSQHGQLRDHDRPGAARHPADRQGSQGHPAAGGGAAPSTRRWSWTHPPTSRIARFLDIATEVGTLRQIGPIPRPRRHRAGRHPLPQTAVHFVTVLEEEPRCRRPWTASRSCAAWPRPGCSWGRHDEHGAPGQARR